MDVKNLFLHKNAFTLAEVLVTLGIIGVVSALTLPTLVKNHQRKVFVTQLHKVYNEMTQAFSLYMTEKNAPNLRETRINSVAGLNDFINSKLKVVKDCGSAFGDCFASKYYYLDGSESGDTTSGTCDRVIAIASGATLCIDIQNGSGGTNAEGNQEGSTTNLMGNVAVIEVDVNGKQEPNIRGRDYFVMFVTNSGDIIDVPYNNDGFVTDDSQGSYNGAFGKIMDDGWEMNY